MSKVSGKPLKKIDKDQNKRIARIEREFKPEEKRYFVQEPIGTGGFVQATNALQITNISLMAQGDSVVTRTGNTIKLKQIHFELYASPFNTTTDSSFLRVMILQDNTWNGTDPVGTDILQNYDTTDQHYTNAIVGYNLNRIDSRIQGKKGIRVLMDKTLTFGSYIAGNVAGPLVRHLKWVKNFKKALQVNYNAATAGTGQIFLAIFPGADTTALQNVGYTWYNTLYFTDA